MPVTPRQERTARKARRVAVRHERAIRKATVARVAASNASNATEFRSRRLGIGTGRKSDPAWQLTRQILGTQRSRRIDAEAERGRITHPDMPHGVVSVIGDLIPDTPAEIALAAATGAAGKLAVKGTSVAASKLAAAGSKAGRASRGVNRTRRTVVAASKEGPVSLKQLKRADAAEQKLARINVKAGERASRRVPKYKPKPKATTPRWRQVREGEVARSKARFDTPEALARAAKGGGKAAKVAGKTATYPIRHPVKTGKYQLYAQAPLAASTGDPGGELKKVLEGKGVAAGFLHGAGQTIAKGVPGEVGKNIVKDLFDLPAQTVPAVYLPLAGLVEAAQGRPERLDQLWKDYKKIGAIPAAFSGDPGKFLTAVKNHPLFTGLELSGARAAVGRGAGAVARGATAGRVASRKGRAPIETFPGGPVRERRYSADVFEQAAQRALDRRRARKHGRTEAEPRRAQTEEVGGGLSLTRVTPAKKGGALRASPRQREKFLRETVDRLTGQEEGARRFGREAEGQAGKATLREAGLGRLSRAGGVERRAGIGLASRGILRSPETMQADLATFGRKLDTARQRLEQELADAPTKERAATIRRKLKANQQMRSDVDALYKADADKIFAAARAHAPGAQEIDRQLAELGPLEAQQARQARLIPFARTHLDAGYGIANHTRAKIEDLRSDLASGELSATEAAVARNKIAQLGRQKQIIDANGNALPPARIEAEARAMGADPETFAFTSQAPRARGARSFYRAAWPERATIARNKLTGKGVEEGSFDPSFDAMVEQRIRGRGIVDAIKGFDRIVGELAYQGRRFKDWQTAKEAADLVQEQTGLEVRPVRLSALRANAREQQRAAEIFDSIDPSNVRGMENFSKRLLSESEAQGPGQYVLLPDQAVTRLHEHFAANATHQRVAQVISSGFKGVVLPTSPNWLIGNLVDVNMRAALSGTTIWGRNARLGKLVMKEIERQNPELATRIKAGLVPGSIYGSSDATRVFRDARQFQGTAIAPLARAMGTLRRTPGVKQTVNVYGKYRDAVFKFNAKFIEDQSFYALLGKQARREVRTVTGRWEKGLRVGEPAIRDLAKGLLKTQEQIRFAKAVEETLGQWTANSPTARLFLVDYAPFAMWTRAATKFILYTLPVKHPIKTAIAAAAMEMTQEERESLGLSHFVAGRLPSNLQGSIPLGGGRLLAPQTVSSFGFFADYENSLAQSILPQYPLGELAGLDWTGAKLTHGDGTPLNVAERGVAAIASMGEAYIPFLAMGKRAAKGGPTAALPRSVRPYDKGLVEWLRKQSSSKTITVPKAGSDAGSPGTSSSGSSGGGWRSSSSSSSSGGGWR